MQAILLFCLFCGGLDCGKVNLITESRDKIQLGERRRSVSLYEKIGSDLPPLGFKLPLQTQGRWLVDQAAQRVKLASVNWYGASDVHSIPAGLEFSSIADIAKLIKSIGFNSVRLPFSNQMLYKSETVSSHLLEANPELIGKDPLQVFDSVINGLSEAGLLVILNNHTTIGKWCCNRNDGNGLWFNATQTAEKWMGDWEFLVNRYIENPMVIGADLRNELREDFFLRAKWGGGGEEDYLAIGLDIGKRILQLNPKLLLIFEGLNFSFDFEDMAKDYSLVESFPGRLVYSPHLYAWFRDRSGRLLAEFSDYESFERALDNQWGHFLDSSKGSVPLWIGEFGYDSSEALSENRGYSRWVLRYLRSRDIDFSWWPLNGGMKPGTEEKEEWGLLSDDWSRVKQDDPRIEQIQALVRAALGPN